MKMVFDSAVLEAVPDFASISDDLKRCAKAYGVTDASETLVFARQLEHIKSRLFKKLYAALKGRQFVPVSNEAGPNKEFITYRVWEGATMAKLITNYSTDFESVTAMASEQFLKFYDFGNYYEYSIRDLQLASSAGVALDIMKAELARDGHELAIDEAIAVGVPQVKTYGLVNNPNVPILSVTTGTWSGATGEQIVADLESIITQMESTTLEIHRPDTILMSTLAYRLIATKAFNSASGDKTVLQVFQDRNPGVSVQSWTRLATANAAANAGRIIAYKKDPTVLEFEMGQEFQAYGAIQVGMSMITHCMSRFAGVVVHQPLAMSYFDNQSI